MRSLRNDSVRANINERILRLTPTAKPLWGKLDAPHMLCHLVDTVGMGLGEVRLPAANKPAFQRFPLKHLILYVLPMPRNAPTAPALVARIPADFHAERARLVELISRLASAPSGQGVEHPFFGPLSNEQWNIHQWKHLDHHLRQFGL